MESKGILGIPGPFQLNACFFFKFLGANQGKRDLWASTAARLWVRDLGPTTARYEGILSAKRGGIGPSYSRGTVSAAARWMNSASSYSHETECTSRTGCQLNRSSQTGCRLSYPN